MKVGIVIIKIIIQCLTFQSSINGWAVGASVGDVPTLSSLGRVVRTMGSTADALPPGMVRTYLEFWL
jgi:hypothetical protein